MILKRKFLITIFSDLDDSPVDYCFSNTVEGCLVFARNSCRFYKKDLDILTFKIQVVYD